MSAATVSEKGWVVIPHDIRVKYGLKQGSKVGVVDMGGVIRLIPLPDDVIANSRGLFKGGPSLAAELVAEHRAEAERDARDGGDTARS